MQKNLCYSKCAQEGLIMTIDAEYIRRFAADQYVTPARMHKKAKFSIAVKPVEALLKKRGLPQGRTPLVCSALRGNKFQKENGLVLDHWDGPPSGQSTTVVYHFRFADDKVSENGGSEVAETPEQWALRLTNKIRGLMKNEIAAHGGTEGFMRWVRSEDEEDAA
jgi:hypothetical protein